MPFALVEPNCTWDQAVWLGNQKLLTTCWGESAVVATLALLRTTITCTDLDDLRSKVFGGAAQSPGPGGEEQQDILCITTVVFVVRLLHL